MKCPSCDREQPDGGTECVHCGVIFAKWTARVARTAAEPETPPPPRLTWKAFLPWTTERTRLTLGMTGWLAGFLGLKGLRQTMDDAVKESLAVQAPPKTERIARFLRVLNTVILAVLALSLILSEGYRDAVCVGLVLIYLLWFPWKPARVLAALALIPLWAGVGWMAIIIIGFGGPDARGGGCFLVPLGIVYLTGLVSLVYVCVADIRSRVEPPKSGGRRGFSVLAHIAALLFIAHAFWRAHDRRENLQTVEDRWQEQQRFLEEIKRLPESERTRFEDDYALEEARRMPEKEWRRRAPEVESWVRERVERKPQSERPRFEQEWERVFQSKKTSKNKWRSILEDWLEKFTSKGEG